MYVCLLTCLSLCASLPFAVSSSSYKDTSPTGLGPTLLNSVIYWILLNSVISLKGFPGGLVVKNLPANAGDAGLIPGLGRSPGGGNGNPLQYSCLGNPMDRGAWWAAVHEVTKSQTQLTSYTLLFKDSISKQDYILRYWEVGTSTYEYLGWAQFSPLHQVMLMVWGPHFENHIFILWGKDCNLTFFTNS